MANFFDMMMHLKMLKLERNTNEKNNRPDIEKKNNAKLEEKILTKLNFSMI